MTQILKSSYHALGVLVNVSCHFLCNIHKKWRKHKYLLLFIDGNDTITVGICVAIGFENQKNVLIYTKTLSDWQMMAKYGSCIDIMDADPDDWLHIYKEQMTNEV